MDYKEITADEYEKLLQNKNNIFNNTFKNTDKIVRGIYTLRVLSIL